MTIFFTLAGCAKSMVYKSIGNASKCEEKGGYWYKEKCWKGFEDEGIPESQIDSVVAAQMKVIEKSFFTLDNVKHPLVAFMPIEEKEGMLFIAVYGKKDNFKTLIFPTGKKKIKNGKFESAVILFKGDAISGEMEEEPALAGNATVNVLDLDNLDVEFSGMLAKLVKDENGKTVKKEGEEPIHFSFKANESIMGAGNSHFEIKNNEAYLSGDLGTITYAQLKDLIQNHPTIKTIVMTNISGSVNDAVNMHTGRLLRQHGFTTKVLSDSDIASGGVDLFCAGIKRIVEKGAKIGVHSWCCVNDKTAIEIPKDHPAHQYQIEYFTRALGKKMGPDFYFYTLEASPFDSVHYMSDEEIKKWTVATEFLE